jgi:hypothetical protein
MSCNSYYSQLFYAPSLDGPNVSFVHGHICLARYLGLPQRFREQKESIMQGIVTCKERCPGQM